MNYRRLKKIRVFCGIASLLLILGAFLFPVGWQKIIPLVQIGPGSIRLSTIIGGLSLGVILLAAITLLFGRVFCSFLCPLGVSQDVANHLRRASHRRCRKSGRGGVNHRWLRYCSAAVLIAVLAAGAALPCGIVEPFAVFGRFCNALLLPLVIAVTNRLADIGLPVDPRAYVPVVPAVTAWAVASFVAIMVVAFFRGRLFCNTLCPVGAVLGLIGRFAIFKVRFADTSCVECGRCAAQCKSDCIDYEHGVVDHERCVVCFNCLTACGPGAMEFGRSSGGATGAEKTVPATLTAGRREFLVAGGTAVLGALATRKVLGRGFYQDIPVMPPGAGELRRFMSKCTACHLCVSNCPGNVLKPALLQYGPAGIMQPRLDFSDGMCEFDCTVCSEICPNGALLPLSVDEKHRLQIGTVWFRRRDCVVRLEGTHCGACAEICPTGAVTMVPFRGGRLTIPHVEPRYCVGCGACEHVCPATPKAIGVYGLKEHDVADPKPHDSYSPATRPASQPSDDFLF